MSAAVLTRERRDAIAQVCRRHGIVLCYVFGSRTTPYADAASDWDLGVVFDRATTRRSGLDLWLDVVPDFEALFSPDPVDLVLLQQASPAIRSQAIQGQLLYAATELARADFEEHVMRVWMDLRPFLDAQDHDIREGLLLRGYVSR